MKIVLITDTHAGVRNDSVAFHNYSKKFYDNVFFPYLDKNGIRDVVHLGDILDRRKYVNIYTAKRLFDDFVNPLMEREISYHQILGNHDCYYNNTNNINSFTELFRIFPLNIYEQATEVMFGDCKILFVPWINSENREHTLKLIKETNAQICFGHLELAGFQMFKGSIVSHGDDASLFGKFDVVCSGHFHHRSSSGNVHYLGTHCEFTWSDYNDSRGFHIFDTETRTLEFIENPYKMFKKVWYNDAKELPDIDFSEFSECIVKVIVSEKNNPYMFEQFVDKIEKSNPHDIQIVEDHLNLGIEEDSDIVNEAESTVDIFKKYIEGIDTKIDKKKIEQKIISIYQEALAVE